jgi:glyoxylase-like metal-dependent hydrolase (beta-lactamase superfamily II)/8-oxo-dGTP pyrophosphatase MutT (NUDIX family)
VNPVDVNPIVAAASVLLTPGPGSPEVFLVRRSERLRFMGGFAAFPGGKVHRDDAALAARGPLDPRQAAAVRELFEETGVLLARTRDGAFPPNDGLPELRRQVLAETLPFAGLLDRLELHLDPRDLAPVASLVTPAFSPMRFDTAFYLAHAPPGQAPEVWPGELSEGAWRSADAALRLWEQGDLLISPPTVTLLEAVRGRPFDGLAERLRPLLARLEAGALHPIWYSPGVRMLPLACAGLPPAAHTNAYLIGGGPCYLFDPAPTDGEERRRLYDAVEEFTAGGRALAGVVLSHHHPDHVGAAAACAARYRVPVLAHPETARLLAGKVAVDRALNDGDRLDLGPAPHGRGAWHLEALLTPGHAPGHLTFYEPYYRLLFVGDMASTLSSVVIAPPEGDLTQYLESLRRLKELPSRLLLPAHGPASARPAAVLDDCLAHRAKREEQLVQALGPTPRTVADLTLELYRGLPANLMRLAEAQTVAGLIKLRREGRAQERDGGWALADPDASP